MTTSNIIINLLALILVTNKKVVTLNLQKPFVYVVSYFVYRLTLYIYYNTPSPEYGLVFYSDVVVLLWYSSVWQKAEKKFATNSYGLFDNIELQFQRIKKDKMTAALKSRKMRIRIKKK